MALDGIFVHHLIKELNEKLSKSRLESFTLSGLSFVLSFYKEKQRLFLNINLNASFASMYLTKEKPLKGDTSNFLSQLKKYIEGGILDEITQYMSDRVFILHFTVYDYILGPIKRKLIFEAMGKHANLFILENDMIIDCYKRMFIAEGRHLIPNAPFEFFSSTKLDATLYTYQGFDTAKEIQDKYLGISQRLALYLTNHFIKPYDIDVDPVYSPKFNKAYFFNIFEDDVIHYPTLSEALDAKTIEKANPKLPYLNFVDKELKKMDKKMTHLQMQNEDAIEHLDDKEKGDQTLHLLYASSNPDQDALSKRAQDYYKHYKKAKRALEFISNELSKLSEEKLVFENFLNELNISSDKELIDFKEILAPYGFLKKHHKNDVKPIRHKVNILTLRDLDATYFIGKNALQNAKIMHELGDKSDYWFHVKDASGSHVLVRTFKLDESIIRKAAMLAAYYSSLNLSASIPVNYTPFKYVSKINGRPASFVKIKNEKTIFIDIDPEKIKNWVSKT